MPLPDIIQIPKPTINHIGLRLIGFEQNNNELYEDNAEDEDEDGDNII
jgi:hypothetical protein